MLTAEENIVLPLAIAGETPDQRVAHATWSGGRASTTAAATGPAELSGGQQQRVAIVRALVSKPTVVFADEPTGNLDSHSSAEILDLLRSAVDDFGQTIVMVTHDPAAAALRRPRPVPRRRHDRPRPRRPRPRPKWSTATHDLAAG